MEYKAVTKLQMFCLDFRKQHIFTPDKTSLSLIYVKIIIWWIFFYETS